MKIIEMTAEILMIEGSSPESKIAIPRIKPVQTTNICEKNEADVAINRFMLSALLKYDARPMTDITLPGIYFINTHKLSDIIEDLYDTPTSKLFRMIFQVMP